MAAAVPAVRSSRGERLSAYLRHVETHARGFVSPMRGGIGSDGDVRAIVDGVREAPAVGAVERVPEAGVQHVEGVREAPAVGVVERVPEAGVRRPSPRLAVRGRIGFVEAVRLAWIERGEPSPQDVARLCRAQPLAAIGG